ncbi:MAG: enoyl-CoA hydratase-related protein [Chloroflexota bacterium]
MLAKIGSGAAREWFLTGERFDASSALTAGLVRHVVPADELDAAVAGRVDLLLQAAPEAQAAIKALIRTVAGEMPDSVRSYTADLIARRRASEEGREGMSAFLERREPWWRQSLSRQ